MRRIIREIHRRSLWQVLGVYLAGAWFGYEIVLALTEGVGLPTWVPPFALVLFVIGLPVVLATAIVQEGHPLAGSGEAGGAGGVEGMETAADAIAVAGPAAPDPAAPGTEGPGAESPGAAGAAAEQNPRPLRSRTARVLTWHRAITAGVLAFALLGLATVGFLGMRHLGIGPAATLVSSGVLESQPAVVLADFEAEDEGIGEVVTEALRIDLQESTALRVADPAYVADALGRMERDASSPVTAEVAREVALREGLPAVITGEVRTLGGAYVLSARVEDAEGTVLEAFRTDAESEAELLEAVDELSARIREETGESLRSVRRSEPLATVTTSSLEALRLYSRGAQVSARTGDYMRAAELFARAVEVDSTFAMAWRKLGVTLGNAGGEGERIREAYDQAYRHRERAAEHERYLAEAGYHQHVRGDRESAAASYRTLLELDPDNTIALNNLSILLSLAGHDEEAAALLRRVVRIQPTARYYSNLANFELELGNFAAADSARAAGLALEPRHVGLLLLGMAIASSRHRHDTIAVLADSLEQAFSGSPVAVIAEMARASIDAIHGRIRQAEERLRAAREVARRAGIVGLLTDVALQTAAYPLLTRGDSAEALRRVNEALETLPLDRMAPSARPEPGLAQLAAYAGRPGLADSLLAVHRRVHEEAGIRYPEGSGGLARSAVARARGRSDEALDELRRLEGTSVYAGWIELERGMVHEAAGRTDEAIAAYERALDVPGAESMRFAPLARPFLLHRLAELHDDAGNVERARSYYAAFVELWRDADPELQPRVDAARGRLAQLLSEG